MNDRNDDGCRAATFNLREVQNDAASAIAARAKGWKVRVLPVRTQRSESHFILDQTLAQIAAKVAGEPIVQIFCEAAKVCFTPRLLQVGPIDEIFSQSSLI